MNKTIGILSISVMMIALFAVFASAGATKFCTDSDNGIDIWTPGIATDEKGPNADDCDGASENLKEFYCDGDKVKLDNIKCTDYDAVCITVGDKTVPDYCDCPQNYVFSEKDNRCLLIGNGGDGGDGDGDNQVPIFPGITIGFAVIGAGLGLALLRKQH